MSFYCEHCHFKNTEVTAAGEIQERGLKYTMQMDNLDDLERQVVKSDTAVFRLEDLDIEIPAGRGRLTNLEGVLGEVLKDLEFGQEKRKVDEPELFEKIDRVVQALTEMMRGRAYPFTISLDDPAGNSWIEPSPKDPMKKYSRTEYARTPEQNANLGLGDESNGQETNTDINHGPKNITDGELKGGFNLMEGVDIIEGQMYSVPCPCPGCMKSATINMQMVNIPYFKQVIISALVCEKCGYRTNDVKTGGEIPAKGQRIWLEVKDPIDLQRDILKSETCLLKVPACNLEAVPGTMGGRFTTVEGLLTQIRDDLRGSIFDTDDVDGLASDSMPGDKKSSWNEFFAQLNKAIKGEITYTVLLEDPLASSYVQSLCAPDPDPQITTEEYERTADEEDELGLADMKTQMGADGEYVKETNEVKETEVNEIPDEKGKGAEEVNGAA